MKPTHLHHDLRCRKTIPFVLLATALASSAWGQSPVTIQNPGFEDPVISSDGGYQSAPVPGWATFNGGNTGVLNPSSAGDLTDEAPEGANVGLITSSSSEDGLSQVLSSALIADAQYALTLKVANTKLTTGFPGYRVQLVAGGTVIAEDDNSQSIAEDVIATSTVNYTYDAGDAGLVGQPLEIRLLSKGLSSGEEVAFDDVQLTVALANPVAVPGGPYTVSFGGSLSLDGSGSLPSDGATITTWEWDLDNDGLFNEAITGATPASITHADLQSTYGMIIGANTIKLRVTDSAAKTSTVEGTVTLGGELVIYEPFNDLDPTLNGNTPGLGLSGTWIAGSNVADTSLTYGILGYQGGRVVSNPNGGNAQTNTISPGTTLIDAGLMADGATLWFSCLIVNQPQISVSQSNRKTYFSIGTDYNDGFDRVGPTDGSGEGFLVSVSKASGGAIRAQAWTNAAVNGATNTSVAEGDTFLAVGKITWGEFGVANDVFELYLPDKDLNLGSPVSTVSADFDQLGTVNAIDAFDSISISGHHKLNSVPEVDEIRFGATSAAVLPLDFTDPLLVSTDNTSGSSLQRVATFDEELYVGTGDIRIVNETTPGTTTIPVGDPQIVLSGNTLTIIPTVPLGSGTYHIEIDAGALTDRNLNGFAGISDPNLWKFTVDDTPPTVASFGDNTFPKPILTNSSTLVYTVTFSETIDAGTVEIADFAATAGSVPITIDDVSVTDDPAVFEVAVSTLSSSGSLALEIVQGAVITDVNGNELDTTTAIPSDNTLTVNDPTPNAGSITNDFQGTIASQNNPNNTGSGEARYFHVSVNPDNPGTGWYCANLPGTDDPAPAGVRNYTGPVVAYKMLGNGGDGNVTSTAGSGGDDARITYATDDVAFDAFGQQQMRLWTDNDPGADLATAAGTGATGFASVGNYGYRDWQGATGIVDISGLASGSVHIYYGAYNDTPTLKVIMRDTDNVGADIVLNDVHSIADGGNGDAANRGEYYLAEIDFVSDGVYDLIIYEWASSNGRGLGTVLTGPDSVVSGSPYADWATTNAPSGNPDDDFDGDGVPNAIEFVLGGLATTNDLDKLPAVATTGGDMTFTFVRNQDSVDPGVETVIEVGTDLAAWPDAYTVGADTAGSSAGVTVTDNLDGTDTITLTVVQAPDEKKFARLKVIIAP